MNNSLHADAYDWGRIGITAVDDLKGVIRDILAENYDDILKVGPGSYGDFEKIYGTVSVYARVSNYGVFRLTMAFLI